MWLYIGYVPYVGFPNFPKFFYLTWLDGVPREIRRKTFEAWKQKLCYNDEPLPEQTQPLALFFEEEKTHFHLMILLDSFTRKQSFRNLI